MSRIKEIYRNSIKRGHIKFNLLVTLTEKLLLILMF